MLGLSLLSLQSLYAELPQDSRRPGGIAVIPLGQEIKSVRFNQQNILISNENTQRYAILGIPLNTPIGTLTVDTNVQPIQIEIKPYAYAEQRIKVQNQDYVDPSEAQLARYAQEAKQQNAAADAATKLSEEYRKREQDNATEWAARETQ